VQQNAREQQEQVRALAEAMNHPFRGRLLAVRLGAPKRKVRYHVEALEEKGLVEVGRIRALAGVVERFYRSCQAPLVEEELDDRDLARGIVFEPLKAVFADASASIRAKIFGVRPGHTGIRLAANVDQEGWAELSAIQVQAFQEALSAVRRAEERTKASTEPTIPAVIASFLFEVLPWPEG
jgi:DNA-binding transcriptional ArsR family regulator